MKEKTYNGTTYLEPEKEDLLNAEVLGKDHTVEDWPYGRTKRCSMHFFVESGGKRGERFVKQSTYKGKMNKPKLTTYQTEVLIIRIGDQIGHVSWSKTYGIFTIRMESSKYSSSSFYSEDAQELVKHFFGKDK